MTFSNENSLNSLCCVVLYKDLRAESIKCNLNSIPCIEIEETKGTGCPLFDSVIITQYPCLSQLRQLRYFPSLRLV